MIRKYWELRCDFCEDSILYGNSRIGVEKLAKLTGWTVKNGKHCCKACFDQKN